MSPVISKIMPTVNASYKVQVTPDSLVEKLKNTKASDHDCSVLAFLSEVSLKLQYAFIKEMGISLTKIEALANDYSKLCGYRLPLAKKNKKSKLFLINNKIYILSRKT